MTLAELLASARGGQSVGFAQTRRELTSTAAEDRRTLNKALQGLKDSYTEAGEQFKDIKRDSSLGRLLGGAAGFLFGGAPGRAFGGTVGSEIGRAGRKVKNISSQLLDTTFGQGLRDRYDSSRNDINKFINTANQSFTDSLVSNAIQDLISGVSLERAGFTPEALRSIPGFARSTDAEGNVLGLGKGLQAAIAAGKSKTTARSAEDLISILTGAKTSNDIFNFLPDSGIRRDRSPSPISEDEQIRRDMMYEGFR
jgi:hypothetical protein